MVLILLNSLKERVCVCALFSFFTKKMIEIEKRTLSKNFMLFCIVSYKQ